MASLLVVLIILGCVAYQYLKSTFIKSFAVVITSICAGVVAFGYFEVLAKVVAGYSPSLAPWAQMLSFALLFILAFAILQTIAAQLTRRSVDLGPLPERIGRVVCGIFLGLIVSGLLLTAAAMAPIPTKYPYQRFDATSPDAEKPNKVLFNTDGFATGWFSVVSSGSFSGKRSFATLHPDFLDQLFLNRLEIGNKVSIITSSDAIEIPKKAVWPAPEGLKDSDGRPVLPKSGHNLTIVRVGVTAKAIKEGGTFTPSQLRLVCKQKSDAEDLLAGKGKNIYPAGYLKTADELKFKKLTDQIKIEQSDFDGKIKEIDFAFYVPDGFVPVLVEFKQNSLAQVPPPVAYEQAPPPVPFIPLSECATDIAELQPVNSAKVYGVELAAKTKLLTGLTLEISDPNQWQNVQTARSIKPAQFEERKINYVRAELKIEKTEQEEDEVPKEKSRKEGRGVSGMLSPLDNYRLLSLKCSNPSTGMVLKTEQLPVLVELSGLIHHAVGIIASGEVDGQILYEVDYCSVTTEDIADGLTFAEDGTVTRPFPDTVWLTEQAQSISEFYVLYLVKSDKNAIITSVQPADSQVSAGFKDYEGFSVK